MESLNRVIAKAPENKEAFLDRALVHVEIGNKQEALSDYTKSGIKPTPIDPIKDPDKMKLAHAIVEELKETVQIPFDMAMGSAEGIAGNLKRLPGNLVDVTKAYARLPLDATHLVFSAITDPKQVSMQMVDETMALVDYIEKTTIDDFLSKALGVEGKAEWLKLPVADKFKRILRAANDVVMDVAVPGTAFKAAKEFQALNKAIKVVKLEIAAGQNGLELAHATNVGSKIVRGEEIAEILVPLRTAEQKAASVAGKTSIVESMVAEVNVGALDGQVGSVAIVEEQAINRGASQAGSKRTQWDYAPYQKSRNISTTINERTYVGHALDRMQDRGIMPSMVEDAINNGIKIIPKEVGTIEYYSQTNKIIVVVNEETKNVITVFYKD